MAIEELLASARYVVNESGERTAVQLDLQTWENLVSLLVQPETEMNGDVEAAWNIFMRALADSVVDTGISDLAAEHDHYLYGTPKRHLS